MSACHALRRPLHLLAGAGLLLFAALGSAQAQQAPKVFVTVKPVHALVAGVMQGVGEPYLLLKGGESPHSYTLKPSDARALSESALVFWVGESLETFLEHPLETLGKQARIVELAEAKGIETLEGREGGAWESHEAAHDHDKKHDHSHDKKHAHSHDKKHAHDHDKKHAHAHEKKQGHGGHAHDGIDGHLWLDPHNAEAIVTVAAETLAEIDPANAAAYRDNAQKMVAQIEALDAELMAQLAPVKDRPYIVFHDAYQYFEAHYGLKAVGSITLSPERQPSAQRLTEIRKRLADSGAACVFSEPQFRPALVDVVIEGSTAKRGELDPIGAALKAGPDSYFEVMRGLATSLRNCLMPQS
ncbi:MAG: zinc ABC transporter substrate-binding protein [Oceanibaculum nanhaiense]|uniref:zinc ABC transporter substrate-binding protein n=1 Tax=Oceanibaculum nanhaiense TaxID=1909734 RepID=UPI0025A326F4|nr:zinc ABC transporter substrate-binding protein [Oceanibaculum nanhaiense]MDM7946269.1 zinc ABC transporter substrate-binding protein [Oceanibaculum nanhaiense]